MRIRPNKAGFSPPADVHIDFVLEDPRRVELSLGRWWLCRIDPPRYADFMSRRCVFGDASLKSADVFALNERISTMLLTKTSGKKFLPLFVELIKFTVPLNEDTAGEDSVNLSWLLRKTSDQSKLKVFACKMSGAKVYTAAEEAHWDAAAVAVETAGADAEAKGRWVRTRCDP